MSAMLSILGCLVISLSVEISDAVFVPADKEELRDAVRSWDYNASNASRIFGDISNWDVSKVTDMTHMFAQATYSHHVPSFNCDLSKWDVSQVTKMFGMFQRSNFTGDLSKWDVSKVTNMDNMFAGSSFNGDLSKWDVSSVTTMEAMFYYSKFTGDLSEWKVSKVKYHSYMFYESPCSLCDHVPGRFETQCRCFDHNSDECGCGLAPTVPVVLV